MCIPDIRVDQILFSFSFSALKNSFFLFFGYFLAEKVDIFLVYFIFRYEYGHKK